MIRFSAWFGRTLARKFVLLLIGFLALQGVQLVTSVAGNRHLSLQSALINDAGRLRLRTLQLGHLAGQAVAAGSWSPEQRRWRDDIEAEYQAFFSHRLAGYIERQWWIEQVLEVGRQDPPHALLREAQRAWERELRPLLQAIDPARPRTARALLAQYERQAGDQIVRLDRAATLLDQGVRRFSAVLTALQLTTLGLSLLLGVIGLVMARYVVTLPLRRLIGAAGSITGGAYDRRLPVSSRDELGELAGTFNRMADAIEHRTRGIEALNRAAAAVASSLSLPETIDQVLRHAVQLTGMRAASLAFHDPARGRFTEWHASGLPDEVRARLAFRPGGLAEEVFARGEPVLCSDHPSASHPLSDLIRSAGIRSYLCLPLESHASRLGVLCVYRDDAGLFTAEERGLLSAFARLAAQAFENARLHQRTEEMAQTDPLTGLHNRRWLDERLQDEVQRSQRFGKPVSVLMVDVDHFKQINDRYGHPVGDVVLRRLVGTMQDQLRDVDVAVRYGGEEFVVVLPETDSLAARPVAERVRRAVAETPVGLPDGVRIGMTVSIGVACYPGCAADAGMLIDRADQALYVAKRGGRNRVVLYREMLTAEIERDPNRIVALLREDVRNIPAIVTAVAAKGAFYRGHTDLVERTAGWLAAALGLPPAEREALALASRLHDIGMAVIPDRLLNKTEPLTPDEWRQIREHPAVAAQWLEQVPALRHLAPIVRHHHERWDGGGYPDGLRGEAIPYLARVLAVADAYGSLASDWPGRKAGSAESVIAELRAAAGTQLDPELVQALLEALSANGSEGRRVPA